MADFWYEFLPPPPPADFGIVCAAYRHTPPCVFSLSGKQVRRLVSCVHVYSSRPEQQVRCTRVARRRPDPCFIYSVPRADDANHRKTG